MNKQNRGLEVQQLVSGACTPIKLRVTNKDYKIIELKTHFYEKTNNLESRDTLICKKFHCYNKHLTIPFQYTFDYFIIVFK